MSEAKGDIAYIRVGEADVGITGCDLHAGYVISVINATRQFMEQTKIYTPPVRVKRDYKLEK